MRLTVVFTQVLRYTVLHLKNIKPYPSRKVSRLFAQQFDGIVIKFGGSYGQNTKCVSSRVDGSVKVIDASKQNCRVTLAEEARLPDARIRGHSDGQGRFQGANCLVSKCYRNSFMSNYS